MDERELMAEHLARAAIIERARAWYKASDLDFSEAHEMQLMDHPTDINDRASAYAVLGWIAEAGYKVVPASG